jgi:hypothetical protein
MRNSTGSLATFAAIRGAPHRASASFLLIVTQG